MADRPTIKMMDEEYDIETIRALREDQIVLRQGALDSGRMDYALSISKTIAVLAFVIAQMEAQGA